MTGSKNLKIGDYNLIYDVKKIDLLGIDGDEGYVGSDGDDLFLQIRFLKLKYLQGIYGMFQVL